MLATTVRYEDRARYIASVSATGAAGAAVRVASTATQRTKF